MPFMLRAAAGKEPYPLRTGEERPTPLAVLGKMKRPAISKNEKASGSGIPEAFYVDTADYLSL